MYKKLEIEGMSCGHCVHAVREALEKLDGVDVADVAIGSAEIDIDPSRVTSAQLEEAIAEEGYTLVAAR